MATIKVERCLTYFRLTLPDGSRELIPNADGGWWQRKHATEALNRLVLLYGMERRAARFYHVN